MKEKLKSDYLAVVESNQRTSKGFRYTVPSSSVYPYQWLWDSCFHAIIYTHFDIEYAKDEIRALLNGQWKNGMVPHIIYWLKSKKHRRIDWGIKANTSSITQPPMIAYAVETIFEKSKDIDFVKEVLDKLDKYYRWLNQERSSPHLLSIIHPWESGEDNFVAWDEIYGLTNPSKEDLMRVKLKLVADYNKINHDTKKFLKTGKFNLQCILFNAVYLRSLESMLFLCQTAKSPNYHYYKEIIPKVRKSFKKKLYHRRKGLFASVYQNKHLSQVENSSIFLPLFAKIPARSQARELIEKYLLNENKFWLKYPVPTVSADNLNFQPNRYWRGTAWLNINWFIVKGLDNYGYKGLSDRLKKRSIQLIEKSRFCEYFNPVNGLGRGPKDFTWSGLIFDM